MTDDLTRAVAQHIARYLLEHPAAADTVEGVHFVWVGPDVQHVSIDVTQAALQLLFDEGRIACAPIGSRLLWRARRDPAS